MTAEEGDDGETKGGRAANIIINQRSCDVNVKLPEPIWSCITRGGLEGNELANCKKGSKRGRGWPMGHCESYLSCCLHIHERGKGIDDPRRVVVPIGRLSMVIACTKRHM